MPIPNNDIIIHEISQLYDVVRSWTITFEWFSNHMDLQANKCGQASENVLSGPTFTFQIHIFAEFRCLKRAFRLEVFAQFFLKTIWQIWYLTSPNLSFLRSFVPEIQQIRFSLRKAISPLEILPRLPITNNISKSYCLFLILNTRFRAELLSKHSKGLEL